MPHLGRLVVPLLLGALALLALTSCSDAEANGSNADPDQVDSVSAPELGACRVLTPDDVSRPTNATRTVDCKDPHNAQTFAVGDLPDSLRNDDYDSSKLGAWAYKTCSARFMSVLGADESLSMRTIVSWAWFRPSEKAWEQGARWYRCDVVGGSEQTQQLVNLPDQARGLFWGQLKDKWLVCAQGDTVSGSVKVPCSEKHDWRAVTTIVVGEKDDPYPGDRAIQVKTRDYCSNSVGAWLGYPANYDIGYTYFHEAEWQAGNRRSVCWAKTDQ